MADMLLIPINTQVFVANQLSVNDISVLAGYAQRETTKREHTALIRKFYGYHEFGIFPWSFRLTRLLYARSTLVRANTRLVDYQFSLPLAKKWGGGEVASADGMRFVTPVRTIEAIC